MAYTQSNEIKTRISLKYDTLANWQTNNPVLLAGEIAFVTIGEVTVDADGKRVIPPVMFKVGDGTSNFKALGWGAATAADVYDWAKKSAPDWSDFAAIPGAKIGLTVTEQTGTNDGGYVNGLTWDADTKTLKPAVVNFDTVIDDTTKDSTNAPQTKAVKAYVDAEVAKAVSGGIEGLATQDWVNTQITNNAVNTVAPGSANGTIAVDGTDVAVKGLGSAAYTDASAYKTKQTAVAEKGNADKTLKISQNANGEITVTEVPIAIASTAVSGLGDAAAKNVDTVIDTANAGGNLPTSAAVKGYVDGVMPNYSLGGTPGDAGVNANGVQVILTNQGNTAGTVNIKGDGAYVNVTSDVDGNITVTGKDWSGLITSAQNTAEAAQGAADAAQADATAAKEAIEAFLDENAATDDVVNTLKEIQAGLDAGEASAASLLAEVNKIKSGETAVGHANMATKANSAIDAEQLDGHDSTYFAVAETVTTALAGKADNTVTITGTDGLTGGGDLTANRTIGLSDATKQSLAKADSAVQTVATGATNGTIAVDGTDVAVKGLGDAAYQNVANEIDPADTGLVQSDQLIDYVNDRFNTFKTTNVDGKADKVANATAGNLAALDANGNLTDSGHEIVTTFSEGMMGARTGVPTAVAIHDYASGAYIAKKTGTTAPVSTIPVFTADGDIASSGKTVNDFATSTQGGKADTAVQPEDLAAIATTGNVADLVQTENTYVLFNCGTSSTVI